MCLGIPARVEAVVDRDRFLAQVDIAGVRRDVSLICVAEAANLDALVGRWVLVHVGFAMSVIDEAEAARTLEVLEQLGELQAERDALQAGRDA